MLLERAGFRDDVTAIDQPLQGFAHLLGRKILLQLVNKLRQALPIPPRSRPRCTIELAIKKKLPVLGIEAQCIGWKRIDRVIRRELQNLFTGIRCKTVKVFDCHEVCARPLVARTWLPISCAWHFRATRFPVRRTALFAGSRQTQTCVRACPKANDRIKTGRSGPDCITLVRGCYRLAPRTAATPRQDTSRIRRIRSPSRRHSTATSTAASTAASA